jgi:hypothetical protein
MPGRTLEKCCKNISEMEENKFDSILNILRRSKPVLTGTDKIEERVLNEIQLPRKKEVEGFNLFDYLFGWVYIGWIRKSLITVSFSLITLFIYQQLLILKRIDMLESQTATSGSQFVRMNLADPNNSITTDNLTRLRLKTGRIVLDKKQINELMNSYNEMEHKYKDLIRIIEEDPELKKILEEKLSEKNKKKFNL